MKTDHISKLVEELVGVFQKQNSFDIHDKNQLMGMAKEALNRAIEDLDLNMIFRGSIRAAMKEIDVVHANITEKDIIQHRIITKTKESEEVNAHMKELTAQIKELQALVKDFEYREKVEKAIKESTDDLHVFNAVVQNIDVVNANIIEKDVMVEKVVEELKIVEIPKEVEKIHYREEYITIKKLVFPDGREVV